MIRINGLSEGASVFKALGSEVRMNIVELLAKNNAMSLNEISDALGLTGGALTPHIRMLNQASLIKIENQHTEHGLKKICSLATDQILLNIYPQFEKENSKVYDTDVHVGQYFSYSVSAPCGMAGEKEIIGNLDDPRVFSSTDRMNARLIWFHDGSIEYHIPNMLPPGNMIVQLTLSLELSSAEQGMDGGKSADVDFYLNDRLLCSWETNMGSKRQGVYTPSWWERTERRHGYLKMLVINHSGVFIDGVMATKYDNDPAFLDEKQEMRFKIETHPHGGKSGGVAIYGSGFGDYNQNIQAIVHYMAEEAVARF